MFDQKTVDEARKNNDTASEASCANVDLIGELVDEVQYLEERLTGCESLYATLDRATDSVAFELRGIMDEMMESRAEGRQWTAWECRIFIGMVNALVLTEAVGYNVFVNYAVEAGQNDIPEIKRWWMSPKGHFPR